MARRDHFLKDERGAAAVELAFLTPVFFIAVLSMFDIGMFFWRWNQAVEASRVGARLAAVSNPVSSDLVTWTGLDPALAGEPIAEFERVCAPATCTGGVYDAAALARIYYGPGQAACVDTTARVQAGMCDVFPRLALDHVSVVYRASGVDTAGMVGAAKPLITVRVSGASPGVVFIDRLIPGAFAALPPAETTVLAEDLRTSV